MNRLRLLQFLSLSFVMVLVSCVQRGRNGEVEGGASKPVDSVDRFEGSVCLRRKDGTVRGNLRVNIRNWGIVNSQSIPKLELPKDGLRVVQLRGGQVETNFGRDWQKRREDDFWIIPNGEDMGLRTGDDSASIQTIVVRGEVRDKGIRDFGALQAADQHGKFKATHTGLLARTAFMDVGKGPFDIEIRDLLIGPGKSTDAIVLPGAAVLEVRSGQGTLTIDGDTRKVSIGSSAAIDEGKPARVTNSQKDRPLTIRAVIIQG